MNLIDKLITRGIIKKEDTDLYEYSINILKSYIFFTIIIILANLFTKNFKSTILFLIIFFSLRKYCGGFHFDHKLTCFLFSVVLTILIPIISNYLFMSSLNIIFLQLVISILLICFPIIEIPQKKLIDTEKKHYKLVSIKILFTLFIVNICCLYFKFYKISIIFLISIILSFFSVLFGYFKYMRITK